jgi:hypothetical protein
MQKSSNIKDIFNTRKSVLEYCDFKDKKLVLKKTIAEQLKNDNEALQYLHGVIKTVPMFDNPLKLTDFNFKYVDDKLVNIDTLKPFHWVNQSHYDALGDIIYRHIQELMVSQFGLQEIKLPLGYDGKGPYNNIFVSPDWQTAQKLMLIIQGSGAVRAGQWARAVCINDRLSIGSILPYIERCKSLGFSVIVFNPNLNNGPKEPKTIEYKSFLEQGKPIDKKGKEKEKLIQIPGSSTPREHCVYVWDNFVTKSKAEYVVCVAHSAGGDCIQNVVNERGEETMKRLCGIAFTDSVHNVLSGVNSGGHVKHFIQLRCRNWVVSKKALDEPMFKRTDDCLCVSSGHDTHEYTSGTAIESVFRYLSHKIEIFHKVDPQSTAYEDKYSYHK